MTGPIRTRLQPIEEAVAPTTAGDVLQWNGSAYVWAPAGGGGGGAPTTATYVTLSTDATLTNERVLTAGSGISIVDNGAGNTVVISATGGGGGTFGQATATFSSGVDSVIVAIADTGVTATSKIVATVSLVSRDVDEMEMAPVVVAVGTITAGMGFDLICVSLDGDAEGTYTINYTRS